MPTQTSFADSLDPLGLQIFEFLLGLGNRLPKGLRGSYSSLAAFKDSEEFNDVEAGLLVAYVKGQLTEQENHRLQDFYLATEKGRFNLRLARRIVAINKEINKELEAAGI